MCISKCRNKKKEDDESKGEICIVCGWKFIRAGCSATAPG